MYYLKTGNARKVRNKMLKNLDPERNPTGRLRVLDMQSNVSILEDVY